MAASLTSSTSGSFLAARVPDGVCERVLRDGDATRAAVIDGLRGHLGRARTGDVALFWFSGHSGEEPVPDEYWQLEPSGYLQTLVCADSRTTGGTGGGCRTSSTRSSGCCWRRWRLAGAHVVAVLDSYHSGGATHDPDVSVRGLGRAVGPLSGCLPPGVDGLGGVRRE